MQNEKTKTKELVAALDIGTTKVVAIAGYRDQNGKIEIKGFGKVESDGVSRGVVTNIDKVVHAIQEAVSLAQRGVDEPIRKLYVGIAGQHIQSRQHRGILTRKDTLTEISQKDIDLLIRDMHKLVLPPGDKILHVIPQEYTVDNEYVKDDPIGMSGVRLECNFHIITGQSTASNNIKRCVSKAGFEIENITLEPIASARAVLSDEEKEAGVVLVDIGGGTTDVSIFHEGIIRHTAVIPLGGHIIDRDIKDGCKIMMNQAEKLKIKYGSSMAEEVRQNRLILIEGLRGREPKEISEVNLAKIIEARVEEILDFVNYEVMKAGFDPVDLIGGVVLTGGGSLLNNIQKSVEYMTGMNCRIGNPVEKLAHGYQEEMVSPKMSTAVGLLMLGIEHAAKKIRIIQEEPIVESTERVQEEETTAETRKRRSFMDKLFEGARDLFAEPTDVDFK